MIRSLGKNLRDIDIVPLRLAEEMAVRTIEPSSGEQISLPLIAIVGPPRVGSTLMSQLLAAQFQLFYFDNLQHALLRYPYLAFKLSRVLAVGQSATLSSDHGYVTGLRGLSEANFFWPYWFDMSMNEQEPKPDDARLGHIRRVLDEIFAVTRQAMLCSYNAHCFYMAELRKRFRKLVIVNMRRDPVANAVSLLRARNLIRSNPNEWWSIRPKGCETTGTPHEQIACQIVNTYQSARDQRALVPDVPIVDVNYEELCVSPKAFVTRIVEACSQVSIDLPAQAWRLPTSTLRISGPKSDESADAAVFRELFDPIDWNHLWGVTCKQVSN